MPRLNRRVLAITLLLSVVLAGVVFGLHAMQVGRHSNFFGDQADQQFAEGNYREAIRMYRQTLEMDPQNLSVLMGLARSFEKLGDANAAYTFAQRVERIDPTDRENQKRLGRVSLQLRRYADAIERAERLIDTIEGADPDAVANAPVETGQSVGAERAELFTLLANARAGNRETQAAIADYRTAIATGRANTNAYAGLVDQLTRDDQIEAARTVLDQLVVRHADDAAAWIARGRWLISQSARRSASSAVDIVEENPTDPRLSQAQKDAAEALQLAGEDRLVQIDATELSANVALQTGDFDTALELVRDGLQQNPDAASLYQLGYKTLQARAGQAGDPAEQTQWTEQATAMIQDGVQRLSTDTRLLWTLASDHLQHQRPAATRTATDQLDALGFAPPLVRYLRGRLLAIDGNVNAAIGQLEKVRTDVIENDEVVRLVDLSLADLHEQTGDVDRQVAALRRVVAVDTFWLPGRERLAFALLRAGRVDEAVQEYQLVADQPGTPIAAPLNFARLLLLQNLGRDEAKRDWSRLRALLQALEAEPTLAVDVALLRAEMLVAQNQPDDARRVLSESPDDPRTWSARILLEVVEQQFETAAELVTQAQDAVDDSPTLRYAIATTAAATSPPVTTADNAGSSETGREEARASETDDPLARLAQVPEQWDEEQTVSLAQSMVPLLLSAKRYDVAKSLASTAAELRPASVVFRLQLMQIAFETGDAGDLRTQLASLEKIAGRDSRWYYGTALVTAMTGRDGQIDPNMDAIDSDINARAQDLLAEAAVLRPDWALVPSFSAYLHDKAGNEETAIIKYNQAVELGWRNPTSIRRLIALLTKTERFGEADSVIRRLRGGNQPFTSEMARIASEVSVELADLRRAVRLAAEAAETSGSAADYLWLGRLSELTDSPADAESAYRRAIEVNPDTAGPTLAWIGFLERNSRLGEAREALTQFESIVHPSDTASMLVVAEGYQGIGADAEAARVIGDIPADRFDTLAQYQRFYRVVKLADGGEASRDQLRDWLDGDAVAKTDSDARTDVVRWIRRQLALDLAETMQPTVYAPARSLIQQNLTASKSTNTESIGDEATEAEAVALDRRAMAVIEAIYQGGSQPQIALAQFRELMDDGWSPSITDEFMIGQLSANAGDWTGGRRLMLPLLSNAELRQPSHIKTYVRLLLQQGDPAEAALWLDRLTQSGIRDRDTATLTADVLLRRGRYDRLVELLTVSPDDINLGDDQLRWFATTLSFPERFELLTTLTTRLVESTTGGEEANGQAAVVTARNESAVKTLTAATERMGESLNESGEFPGAFYAMQMLRRGECEAAVGAVDNVVASAAKRGEMPEDELIQFANLALSTPTCSSVYRALEKVYAKLVESNDQGFKADKIVYIVVLARIREARGDYDAAVRAYEAILKQEPTHFASANNLATILALQGNDPPRANELIDRLIESQGESLVTLDTKAVCRMAAGDYAAADQALTLAMTQFPHPVVQFHMAQSQLAKNQSTAAKQKFQVALRGGLTRGDVHPLETEIFDTLAAL